MKSIDYGRETMKTLDSAYLTQIEWQRQVIREEMKEEEEAKRENQY
jgi:hypothetical protein